MDEKILRSEEKLEKIADWLELTPQQFDILMIIYKLELLKKSPSPKEIQERYTEENQSYIQNSNLFAQLRTLLQHGYISRRAGKYSLEFDALEDQLNRKREELRRELQEFNQITSRLKENFRRAALQKQRPTIYYMGYAETMQSLVKSSQSTSCIKTTAFFPTITYSYHLAAEIDKDAYLEFLWKNCIKNQDIELKYLTSLDVDFLFNHAFRVFGDPKKAYNEVLISLDELSNQVDKYENLDIRYTKNLQEIDIYIPEKENTNEFFLFTRDEHRELMGSIFIRSQDIIATMENLFTQKFDYAERIKGNKGEEIIDSARQRLEEKYKL